MTMDITEILKGIDYTIHNHIHETTVSSIAYDSRNCQQNSLFVCIKGFKVDGHDYINDAITNGAKFILVESSKKIDFDSFDLEEIMFIQAKNNRKNLAILAKNYYDDPSLAIQLIGVTGTNGKTSVTKIINDIFEGMNEKCGVIGTINHQIGTDFMSSSNTTPESVDLNAMLLNAKKQKLKHVAMEVSSHAIALNRIDELVFDVGIFTNLTEDHLDFHETMEGYFKTKEQFIDRARTQVVNQDDDYGKRIIKKAYDHLLSYGLTNKADLYAENIQNVHLGLSFDVVYQEERLTVETQLFGTINVYNILAAIGAFIQLGYRLRDLQAGVNNIKNVPGRLEYVPNTRRIKVLVDYAHTPDALAKAINICKSFTENKLTTVFGCGGDRDQEKRPIMGAIAVDLSDQVIITNDNPRSESPQQIINDILKGISKENYQVIMDRKSAIEEAINASVKGDTVLIAGKGHETYQIIGHHKEDFDDRLIAKNALKDDING